MRSRILAVAVLVGLLMMAVGQPAFAEQDTGRLVATKLFRGMANAATGWMEIPKQISRTWQQSGPGTGMTWGFVKGIGYAIARSVAGGFEIATFPIPVPENYRPIMQPEYVLSDLPESPQPR